MTGYHLDGGRRVTGEFLAGPPAIRHRLTPAERALKRRMLDRYASQRAALAGLGLPEPGEERFRVAPPVWPWAWPHAGPLHDEAQGGSTFEAFRAHALAALRSLGIDELDEVAEAPSPGAPC